MNPSPLLPPELMATCSAELEWLAPAYACDDGSKHPHGHWPTHVQVLDDAPTWSYASSSSPNYDRYRCQPLDDVPDLSHTPLSCYSNDSSAMHPIPDHNLSTYVPDLDLFSDTRIFKDRYDPPAFPDPSFAWVDSAEEPINTIHSPKPIFGYRTFQFDLECLDHPSSSSKNGRQRAYSQGDVTKVQKRRRDDEENEEATHSTRSKKRRMSLDMPQQLFPIFPDYNCNPPTPWPRSSSSDESCTTEPVPTMEQLFDDMYGWDDVAWSSAFRFTITSP